MAEERYRIVTEVDPTRAVAGLRAVDSGLDRTSVRADRLRNAMLGIFSGVVIQQALRGIVQLSAGFEQSMARVQALTGATTGELVMMERVVRQLGATTQFSSRQVSDGLGFLAQAGLNTNQAIASLESTLLLAEVAMIDMARSADIATNVMSGFGLEANSLAGIVDVLALAASSSNTNVEQLGQALSFVAPIAKAAGLEIETTVAAVSTLGDAGIQATRAGTALRAIFSRLSDAGYDLSQGLVPVLDQLRQSGLNLARANELVGQEASSALLVLTRQVDRLEELETNFQNADGAAEGMAETLRGTLQGAINELNSSFEELVLRIAEFIPLEEGIRGFTNAVRFLSDNITILRDAAQALTFLVIARGIQTAALALSGFSFLISEFIEDGARFSAIFRLLRASLVSLVPILIGLTAAMVAFSQVFQESEIDSVRQLGNELQTLRMIVADLFVDFTSAALGTTDINSFGEALGAVGREFISILRNAIIFLARLGNEVDDLVQRVPGSNIIGTGIARFSGETPRIIQRVEEVLGTQPGNDRALIRAIQNQIASGNDLDLQTGFFSSFGLGYSSLDRAQLGQLLRILQQGGRASAGPDGRTAFDDYLDERYGEGAVERQNRIVTLRQSLRGFTSPLGDPDPVDRAERELVASRANETPRQRAIRRLRERGGIPDLNNVGEYDPVGAQDSPFANQTAALQRQIDARLEALNSSVETATQQTQEYIEQIDPVALRIAGSIADGFDTAVDSIVSNFRSGQMDIRQIFEDIFEDLTTFVANSLIELGKLSIRDAIFQSFGLPSPFSALPGFQTGGQFTVGGNGGIDSSLVAFRATPGERVTVETQAQQQRGGQTPQIVYNFSFNIEGDADESKIERAIGRAAPLITEQSVEAMNSTQRNDPVAIGR